MVNPKVVVFDFDGALVLSNHIKREAWDELFPDEPERSALLPVLAAVGELSRHVILGRLFDELGLPGGPGAREAFVAEHAARYGAIVLDKVKACADAPGAVEVLEKLSARRSLYLSSNTPEADLRETIAARGWERYFTMLFGSPNEKTATLRRVMAREGLGPESLLVVGDGETDRASAEAVGCAFIRLVPGQDLRVALAPVLENY